MVEIKTISRIIIIIAVLFISGCASATDSEELAGESGQDSTSYQEIIPAAERTEEYLPLLKNKRVALVVNPSSRIDETHLLDFMLSSGITVKRVLAPEHGFRGDAEAGEHVKSGVDQKTGIPIVSLYGKNRKPREQDLNQIDLVVFDIQDVGVRFYTYISTMHYVMETCADLDIEFMVLDRPNPNGFFVDGPVLDKEHQSFIGMHPIPMVHGMTTGELAQMINGENWLKNEKKVELTVIPVKNYTHNSFYDLPVAPSPNLPNMSSIYLYPSLGLFEGTPVSIGRGTDMPFQVIGSPELDTGSFYFTPKPIPGASMHPKHNGQYCRGWDLRDTAYALRDQKKIHLSWLIETYQRSKNKPEFFRPFFFKLCGNKELKQKIVNGWNEKQIRDSWKPELEEFSKIRKKYLLYPDADKSDK